MPTDGVRYLPLHGFVFLPACHLMMVLPVCRPPTAFVAISTQLPERSIVDLSRYCAHVSAFHMLWRVPLRPSACLLFASIVGFAKQMPKELLHPSHQKGHLSRILR